MLELSSVQHGKTALIFQKEHMKTQAVVYVLYKLGDFMLVYNARALPFYAQKAFCSLTFPVASP